jgi:Na+/H+ antiporter NhaA
MGVIYKPFGIILGLLAGQLGKKLFDFVWTKIDDQEPPKATTEDTSWGRLLAVATVQGIIFRVTRFVVDRYGAIGFQYLTGAWPGEKRPDPD